MKKTVYEPYHLKCHKCGSENISMYDDFLKDDDGCETYNLFYECDACGATAEEVYRFDRTILQVDANKEEDIDIFAKGEE